MLKRILRLALTRVTRRYGYDTSYLNYVLEHRPMALLRFSAISTVSGFRDSVPAAPWFAASIRAGLWEDCGPCVQLVCDMALEAGVPQEIVHHVVTGDFHALPNEVALVARFTELVLARSPDAAALRTEIVKLWGERGLISIGFTISASRVYPALKSVLGYAQTCSRVEIEARSVSPNDAFVMDKAK